MCRRNGAWSYWLFWLLVCLLLACGASRGFAQPANYASELRRIETELSSSVLISQELALRLAERGQQVTSLLQQLRDSGKVSAARLLELKLLKTESADLRQQLENRNSETERLSSLATQLRSELSEIQSSHNDSLTSSSQVATAFDDYKQASQAAVRRAWLLGALGGTAAGAAIVAILFAVFR